MAYKDKDKQKQANRERQRRYGALHSKGVTEGVINNAPASPVAEEVKVVNGKLPPDDELFAGAGG